MSDTLNAVADCLIVTVGREQVADGFSGLGTQLLLRLAERAVAGVVFDLSAADILDLDDFAALRRLAGTVRLMGGQPIFTGLSPALAGALVEAGAETQGWRAAVSLEEALALLQGKR